MNGRFRLHGRTALVTGAGSGIGRALAGVLAARGCDLALADIDADGLAATADGIGAAVRVTRHRLDVADRAAVAALPAAIEAAHGGLQLLVNNAGVALGGTFDQLDEADFDWLMAINFGGVVRMTRAFLPMLARGAEAQLVNMSSLFGLIAPPGQTAYAASKYAVRGFSEALRHELAAARSGIGVTVVHPGGIRTAIAEHARMAAGVPDAERSAGRARFARALRMPPDRAAAAIADAIERRRARVLVGGDAKVAALAERLLPVRHWALLARAGRT